MNANRTPGWWYTSKERQIWLWTGVFDKISWQHGYQGSIGFAGFRVLWILTSLESQGRSGGREWKRNSRIARFAFMTPSSLTHFQIHSAWFSGPVRHTNRLLSPAPILWALKKVLEALRRWPSTRKGPRIAPKLHDSRWFPVFRDIALQFTIRCAKDRPTCVVLLPFFASLGPPAPRLPSLAAGARHLRNRHPTPVFRFWSTYAETTTSAMLATPTNTGLLALSCPPTQLATVFMLHTRVRRRKSPWEHLPSGTVERSAFLILNPTTTSGLPSFYPVFTPFWRVNCVGVKRRVKTG